MQYLEFYISRDLVNILNVIYVIDYVIDNCFYGSLNIK